MPSTPPARARFAPSPTGRFHIGGARTALYDYLLARQTGGQFILRIEDTDRKRFDPAAERELMESLRWLGIEWDEGPDVGGPCGPYRQSDRKAIYQRYAAELVQRGNAYPCFCSSERLAQMRQEQQKRKQPPRYDGTCRTLTAAEARTRIDAGEPYVIRLRTPREGRTSAVDLIRGPITVDNAELDDYILLKSDGLALYHLAAMVDDREMAITHVLRSSEWLPTFPLHVLIYQAFEWPQPVWVHLSVFLNPSGKGKMSKRFAADGKGGVASIFPLDLRASGYLPEAVVNWLALMGWSYDDHTELFDRESLIDKFSLAKLTPSPAAVNYSKLDHFNGLYIRALPEDELARRVAPFFAQAGLKADPEQLVRLAPLIRERIRTLEEAIELAGFFFRSDVSPADDLIPGKDLTPMEAARALRRAHAVLSASSAMDAALEASLRSLTEELGLSTGQFFGLLRLAVTGQPVSPPLLESMELIGQAAVLRRVADLAARLEARGA
jgi:glutamyl-tRNA synthetase